MARISKVGNNWKVWYEVGFDSKTGKRQRHAKNFRLKKDAELFLAKKTTELHEGTYSQVNTQMSVEEFLNYWINDVKSIEVRGTTLDGYRSYINTHVIPAIGKLRLANLHQSHLNKLYRERMDAGANLTSVLHLHRIIHTALEHAVNEADLLNVNVAKKASKPKPPKTEAHFLTLDQLDRALEESQGTYYHPIFLLLAYTGMRRSEVLGLRYQDVNFENASVSIVQAVKRRNNGTIFIEAGKTNQFRVVTVSKSALLAIRSHQERIEADADILGVNLSPQRLIFDDLLTGNPIDPSKVSHEWERIREIIGAPHVKLHDLRHTHASILISAGVHPKVISDRLGHSSIQITMDLYGHLLPEVGKEASDKFEELMTSRKAKALAS